MILGGIIPLYAHTRERKEAEKMLEDLKEATKKDLENVTGGAGTRFYIYTVKKGDTLSAIAKRFNTTVKELVFLNSERIKDPDLIIPGWELLIPIG